MTDPAKLREALKKPWPVHWEKNSIIAAAKAHLELLESSDIILIRRDAEGNWPGELKEIARAWAIDFTKPTGLMVLAEDLFDALSDSLAKEGEG